jgi:hypothetical protein
MRQQQGNAYCEPGEGNNAAPPVIKCVKPRIAVLLATYNGAKYVEEQIASLARNCAQFTLHWLDDHSTDETREIVRSTASRWNIDLCEWHQPHHLGYPGSFYQLLECVEADIYLYCDQDDIWQPGKIDVSAANLLDELTVPALCFSDSWVFYGKDRHKLVRLSTVFGVKTSVAMRESRAFMAFVCCGHAQCLTRPLRDILVAHKEIARSYSVAHDIWTYLIAVAVGTPRMLSDVPAVLYRRHSEQFSDFFFGRRGIGQLWSVTQMGRISFAKQAQGFLLAAETLPPSPKLDRLVAIGRLLANLDRQQTPAAMFELMRRKALCALPAMGIAQMIACLFTNAVAQPDSPIPLSRTNASEISA